MVLPSWDQCPIGVAGLRMVRLGCERYNYERSVWICVEVCGGVFGGALLWGSENPDPNEDEILPLNDPYDARVLPRDLATVFSQYSVQ